MNAMIDAALHRIRLNFSSSPFCFKQIAGRFFNIAATPQTRIGLRAVAIGTRSGASVG
jgi:hypothetical protein